MARRTPIYTMLDAASISSGLQQDRHNALAVLWEAAANVDFSLGRVRRRVPPADMFALDAGPIRGLHQQQLNNGVRYAWGAVWTAAGLKVSRWYGPAPELIATVPGQRDESLTAPATYADFTRYGDWTLINSPVSTVKVYKPGTGLVALGDAPTQVTQFLKLNAWVMACGYGIGGNVVGWSDDVDISVWTPAEANSAGDLVLTDLDTAIRAATTLGSSVAVYAEDQMALVSFIGNPYYFGYHLALTGIGAVGKMAVCSDGPSNYGVGRNGCWWTDGNSFQYIDKGSQWTYFQEQVNWAQGSKIQVARNDVNGCIEFYFPMGLAVDITEGWSYDPVTKGWGPIPAVEMKVERKIFQQPLVGTLGGKVQLDANNAGALAPLTLTTKPLVMQVQSQDGTIVDAHTDSRVDELILLLKAASNVQCRLGCAQRSTDAFEFGDWFDVTTSTATYLMPNGPSGVFWKLDFRSTAANWQFDLQGWMLFGVVEGMQRTNA